MRNMSFMLTTKQAYKQTKTVTRRQSWWMLLPGTLVQQVEKSQGLKKGESIKKIHVIRILSVKPMSVCSITHEDVVKEGFPDWTPEEFTTFYCKHNKIKRKDICNRIEFEYAGKESNIESEETKMVEKKAVQTVMKNLPKRDKVGRLAKKYVKARDAVTDAKEDAVQAGVALVKAMGEADRVEVKVDGITITLRHVESQDVLKIKKPKE